MEEEPLEEWAARRDARRPKPGDRKAVPLGDGPERGGHVQPDAPRGMLEWDGHRWAPSGVADGHATAAQESNQQSEAERIRLPPFGRLPQAPEPWRPTEVFHRP